MSDRIVAISMGDAVDREMLGFPEREIKRVLFAICTAFIRDGFKIAYAGDLRPGGYTYDMFDFLTGTYAGQGLSPFLYIVPGSVSDGLSFSDAVELIKRTRSVASILLVRQGQVFEAVLVDEKLLVGPKGPTRLSINDDASWQEFLRRHSYATPAEALTDARKTISSLAVGCMAMGGKMGRPGNPSDQYAGAVPGVVEEALLYLEAEKPLIPFGAFGGATRDIAIALGLLPVSEKTPRRAENPGYLTAISEVEKFKFSDGSQPLLTCAARHETAEELAQLALEAIKSPSL